MLLTEYFLKKTDKELKEELKGLNQAINKFECFGVNDLLLRDAIIKELKHRKIAGLMEQLSNELYKSFPARHWAHVNIFLKYHSLKKEFEKSF